MQANKHKPGMKKSTSNNPAGRPKSGVVTDRIHAAVFALLKRGGYSELSIDAISAQARVSRPAVYRRYTSVGQIVLAALEAKGPGMLPMPYTRDLKDDLCKYFQALAAAIKEHSTVGKALRGTLAAALVDRSFQRVFKRFIATRRQPVLDRLRVWDNLSSDTVLESIADTLFGPLLYRLLIRHVSIETKHIQEMVARVFRPYKAN